MTWQVDYLAEQQVVATTVFAMVGVPEITAMVARSLAVAAECATGAILIDARQMRLDALTTELYRLPEIVEELGLTRSHRVAVVIADDSEQIDSFLFVETVFFNRGFPVRLFTEVAAALKWLKSGKRPSRPASGSSPNKQPRPF
ncbi:MAG TPA: hypothetical protein PLU87_12695 [Sedimentisphaerales bacterium]|nr:hypothetical protein [Sedimentisphaerales bacterium]HRS11898.1 hypothetical protein [Sedimentisphaerales bacterium]HRV48575.1 hypothetical protein [Sedimentisphaerales bacterium]